MFYVLAFFVICTVIVCWAINNAPDGYEDETGYHDGVKPKPNPGRRP